MNNTRNVRVTVYRDYAIAFNPTGVADGQLRDAFSVHKQMEGNPNWRVTIHERTISQAMLHSTEQAARDSALKLARIWIDAQSV